MHPTWVSENQLKLVFSSQLQTIFCIRKNVNSHVEMVLMVCWFRITLYLLGFRAKTVALWSSKGFIQWRGDEQSCTDSKDRQSNTNSGLSIIVKCYTTRVTPPFRHICFTHFERVMISRSMGKRCRCMHTVYSGGVTDFGWHLHLLLLQLIVYTMHFYCAAFIWWSRTCTYMNYSQRWNSCTDVLTIPVQIWSSWFWLQYLYGFGFILVTTKCTWQCVRFSVPRQPLRLPFCSISIVGEAHLFCMGSSIHCTRVHTVILQSHSCHQLEFQQWSRIAASTASMNETVWRDHKANI